MAKKKSDAHLLLEHTDTITEKMWLQSLSYIPPQNFSFYDANFKKGPDGKFVTDKDGKMMLESQFRSDIIKRIIAYENTFFPKWIQAWKDYLLYTGDREYELRRKGMCFLTNEKQPIVYTFVNRLHQALFKANFTIKTYAMSESKTKSAKAVQRFIEFCFSSSNCRQGMIDCGFTSLLLGPGYARTTFDVSKEKVKQIKDDVLSNDSVKKVFNVTNNYANFEWVSEFSLFGEPFVPFYEQRDMIYRKVLPIKSIMKKIQSINKEITMDHFRYIIRNPKPFSFKNYEKIKLIKYYQSSVVDSMVANNEPNFLVDNYFRMTRDNNHCEYIERWTEDNLVIFINGFIVFD